MLELPPIDRESRTAPYRQIAAVLIQRIEAGEFQPGDRLPGLYDIVEATAVNRLTARKALRAVADAGLAELAVGMGYYVIERAPETGP